MTVVAEKDDAPARDIFRPYQGSELCRFKNSDISALQSPVEPVPADHPLRAPLRHEWLDDFALLSADWRRQNAEYLLRRAEQVAVSSEVRWDGAEGLTPEGFKFCPVPAWLYRDHPAHEVPELDTGWPRIADLPTDQPSSHARDLSWWLDRAEALKEKVPRVKRCGTEKLTSFCHDCGCVHERPVTCGDHKLCLHCRTERIKKLRARFAKAHELRTKVNGAKGYHQPSPRHGYRWSAKMLTLTVPHSGDAARDAKELAEAWPRFWQRVRRHLMLDRGLSTDVVDDIARSCHLEVGVSDGGHSHSHVYIYGPFIYQPLLAHYWGESLAPEYKELLNEAGATQSRFDALSGSKESPYSARQRKQLGRYLRTRRGEHGRPLMELWKPSLDIQRCEGSGAKIASELAKYLIKDGERDKETGELKLIPPELYFEVYKALHGRRTVRTSRKFWAPEPLEIRSAHCRDCGSRFVSTFFDAPKQARGPPITNDSDDMKG